VVPEITFLTSFLFDELSVLVSLWLDWAFFSGVMLEFYPKEISKIGERLEHFRGVRESWLAKPGEW